MVSRAAVACEPDSVWIGAEKSERHTTRQATVGSLLLPWWAMPRSKYPCTDWPSPRATAKQNRHAANTVTDRLQRKLTRSTSNFPSFQISYRTMRRLLLVTSASRGRAPTSPRRLLLLPSSLPSQQPRRRLYHHFTKGSGLAILRHSTAAQSVSEAVAQAEKAWEAQGTYVETSGGVLLSTMAT